MKMISSPRSRRDLLLLGTAAGAAALMDSPLSAQTQQADKAGALPAIDVKSHGAAGDARADDTEAFQRALEAASAQGGGVVYAPSGRYLLQGNAQRAGWRYIKGIVRLRSITYGNAGPRAIEAG